MSKDPAFLFYPNDYIGGTMGMTFEEKGAYIELLMLQFNRGHMTSHMIGQTVGHLWDSIKDKFIKDDKGLYFNERLDIEKEKRKNFTKSRRNNISGKNQYSKKEKKPKKPKGHMTSHMENGDVNEDVNEDEIKTEIKEVKFPFDSKEFISAWNLWKEHRKESDRFTYKPIGEQSALMELNNLSKMNENVAIKIINQSISKGWKGFFDLKNDSYGKQNNNDTISSLLGQMETLISGANKD